LGWLKKMTSEQHNFDDEITIYDIFFIVKSNIKLIIFVTLSVMLITFGVNLFLPKTYKVSSSFFANSNSISANSAIQQYTALIGVGKEGNLEDKVEEVIRSESMELILSEKLKSFFPSDWDLIKIRRELNFEKKFRLVLTPKSLFILSYESTDPMLSYMVIKHCLDQVNQFNKRLKLSEKLDIIVVLDPPREPIKPTGPRVVFNTVLSGFLTGIFYLFFIFVRRIVTAYKAYESVLNEPK